MAGARIQRYGVAGFASTGFAKTMNDLTLGSFKFFGGKGYQQYDKEIMGRSDNWESFVRGVTKPGKDFKEDLRDTTIIASIKRKSEAEAAKATDGAIKDMRATIKQNQDAIDTAQAGLIKAMNIYNSALATNNQKAIADASQTLIQYANLLKDNSSGVSATLLNNLAKTVRSAQQGNSVDVGAVRSAGLLSATFQSQLDIDLNSVIGGDSAIKEAVKDAVASSYKGVKLDADKMKSIIASTLGPSHKQTAEMVTSAIKSNLEAMQKELADIKAWKRRMG